MVSYLVILLVALAFLLVCRLFFYKPAPRRRAPYVPQASRRRHAHEKVVPERLQVHSEPVWSSSTVDTTVVQSAAAPAVAKAGQETRELPRLSPTAASEPERDELAQTQIVNRENLKELVESSTEAEPALATANAVREKEPVRQLAPEPAIIDTLEDTQSLLRWQVRHFLVRYATISPDMADDVERVTALAFAKLGDVDDSEIQDMIAHIMVQEALQNAQRVYVMTPDDTVLEMVTDAFAEVALGERTETQTLLAYDALAAMTHLEQGHYRILALLLLFHYSRHADNISAAAFRRYAKKYVQPLLQDLPTEYSYYQQLEYLRCTSMARKDLPLGQVLRESYPYFFSYMGFTKEELAAALAGKRLPAQYLVRSAYGDYYKLAVTDAGELPDFFRTANITDETMRNQLTELMQSRPVVYERRASTKVLRTVAPVLARLADAWDSSMLRRSAPTLLGMYIGKLYLKEEIQEDFDLSRWL
ncbi:MAG: hypothetical protein E6102_04615 [Negativicoccus succinicivorans]|uniref:LPO_1073/Vpar_1526 family protein n=1 Tax=Negativicoccus succinicivorans TaxID=620903 RepID=UPI0029128E81|nr:LPO_1073/Vpar_1526 family protein [Negativicoccus succinicivorans]MDU5396025.1 hypothetical protein [Negativicoccus succinicivorans]